MQITIYTLILNGRFLRYRDNFEDAVIQLSVARYLLDELADSAATSRDQALATVFADEIGPEIRYCAHELGRERAYDVDAIAAELSGKHRGEIVEGCDALIQQFRQEGEVAGKGEGRKKLTTLMWEGQPVPVRNPELVDVLLRVQEAEAKITQSREPARAEGTSDKGRKGKSGSHGSKKGVAAYDAILLALSDAEEVARKLVEAQQVCRHLRRFVFIADQLNRILVVHLPLQPARVIFTLFTLTSSINYSLAGSSVTSS
jgi:signal recognition particle subunit SRP68